MSLNNIRIFTLTYMDKKFLNYGRSYDYEINNSMQRKPKVIRIDDYYNAYRYSDDTQSNCAS